MLFCGIDGYSRGWVGIAVNSKGVYQRRICLWQSTERMIKDSQKDFRLSLIDMPVGLNDRLLPGQRQCDILARQLLGWPRCSSIFIVPHRESLSAKTIDKARQINQRICGKKVSFQIWNIARRIQNLDRVFTKNPSLQSIIRESHPELCFWMLNQKRIVINKKGSREGCNQRLRILSRYTSTDVVNFLNFAKNELKQIRYDDIIDAMVLALSAALCFSRGMQSIPNKPQVDSRGLRMEIALPLLIDLPSRDSANHAYGGFRQRRKGGDFA